MYMCTRGPEGDNQEQLSGVHLGGGGGGREAFAPPPPPPSLGCVGIY